MASKPGRIRAADPGVLGQVEVAARERLPEEVGFAGSKLHIELDADRIELRVEDRGLVARRWLPAVVSKRNSAFWPAHVQIAVLLRSAGRAAGAVRLQQCERLASG